MHFQSLRFKSLRSDDLIHTSFLKAEIFFSGVDLCWGWIGRRRIFCIVIAIGCFVSIWLCCNTTFDFNKTTNVLLESFACSSIQYNWSYISLSYERAILFIYMYLQAVSEHKNYINGLLFKVTLLKRLHIYQFWKVNSDLYVFLHKQLERGFISTFK